MFVNGLVCIILLLIALETGRVLSVDSVAWVKTMEEPNKTPVEKFEALKKAIITHALYMVDAAAGKGIDR